METKTIEALRKLSRVLSEQGRRFVLIGAMVPQIVLDFLEIDAPGSRETRDVDAVAEVASWEDFTSLRDRLLQEGFRQGRVAHEYLWDTDVRIDLIPFGPALVEGGRLAWPNDGAVMNVCGLEEALECARDEKITDDLTLPVVTIPGSVLTKIIAYEDYKKAGVEIDKFEAGREQALVGIFKSRYLKRFESSIEAFRISVRRALAFLKTFESYILDGRLIKSTDFHKILSFLSSEDEEDDATPGSLADEIDANAEARAFLETLGTIDATAYNLRKLHEAVQYDVEVLSAIWQRVKDIRPENDAKLARLKDLLSKELKGKKVLIFSYYKDTARYLYRHLGHPDNPRAAAFRRSLGNIHVRRMDSGADAKERVRIIEGFAPRANGKPDWIGTDKEIDVLISTDVLSEGQNLQDCGHLVNYDLHWNPTRMVQRAGRIDRIGTEFETLWIYNMFPDQGLERLLGLVQSLSIKIADIDQAGFLDASVLGETVHPRNFNTLRRISEEDGSVIDEEEQFTELASSEFLMQQLRALIDAGGQETLHSLPDGIHSGLAKAGARGIFFYFQGRQGDRTKSHFWKYYDMRDQRIIDNRYIVANLIACQKDTPRIVDPEILGSIFDLQEKVVEDILQSEEEKRALEVAPRAVDPIQQTVATALQSYLNHPDVDRKQAIEAIRFLNQPMLRVQVQQLRKDFREFQRARDVRSLIGNIENLRNTSGSENVTNLTVGRSQQLNRGDLRLICFDVLTSG